jgi:hypothetical protein
MSSPTRTERLASKAPIDLESELRRAVEDIERGDYLQLTPKQLERWAATGELPWLDESRSDQSAPPSHV